MLVENLIYQKSYKMFISHVHLSRAINPIFGTMGDFETMIAEAKR